MPDRSDLMQRRALPLGAKVLMTQNRIREWYNHFNGDVFVSFSGGKDSTVLAHLVKKMYPDVPLVFSNTGLEYPEIQSFARKMGAEFLRPKMQFSEVISKFGYPIISKEISEAIYYARRIRNGGGITQQRSSEQNSTVNVLTKKRREDGKICMDSKRRNVLTGGNGKILMGGGTPKQDVCKDNIRRNLLTGGNGKIAKCRKLSGNESNSKGSTDGLPVG